MSEDSDFEAVTTESVTDEHVKPDPKKRLGRGLSALFEDEEDDFSGSADAGQTGQQGSGRTHIGVDQLEPGSYQPRRHMDQDSIDELAKSIAAHGILQPIVVRQKTGFEDTYEIIAGERRWRAAQVAQLHDVPVIIRELTDEQALEFGLIENLQREDLNPIEEAYGYKQLIEEFGHTQEKVAAGLGKSRSHVANTVRLLNLPPKVQGYIQDGQLSAGAARALITAENPEELAKSIINQGLSVREIENLVGSGKTASSSKKPKTSKPEKDVDTLALEKEVANVLGMNVSIDMQTAGKGSLSIQFKTLDQLDEVLHRLSHFPGRQQTG